MMSTTQSIARSVSTLVIALLASSLAMETAQAQMFGARSLGQPLTRRTPTGAAAPAAIGAATGAAGVVQGDERFLRGNRDRSEFVGPNRGSQQGFVGSGQAIGVGRVRTSVETLQEPPDRSSQINRPIPPPPAGAMYYPRLSISAAEMATTSYTSKITIKRDAKLELRLSAAAGSRIQVFHREDRTVLSGVVASESMIEKLRILASFEPHIETIESQLVIASQLRR